MKTEFVLVLSNCLSIGQILNQSWKLLERLIELRSAILVVEDVFSNLCWNKLILILVAHSLLILNKSSKQVLWWNFNSFLFILRQFNNLGQLLHQLLLLINHLLLSIIYLLSIILTCHLFILRLFIWESQL